MNKTYIQDLPHLEDIMSSAQTKTRQYHPANTYENFQNQFPQQPNQVQQNQQPNQFVQQEYYEDIPNFSFRNGIQEDELSCIRVAGHVENCPICKKFYNVDTSKYIITIIGLIILNIYLLRRVI